MTREKCFPVRIRRLTLDYEDAIQAGLEWPEPLEIIQDLSESQSHLSGLRDTRCCLDLTHPADSSSSPGEVGPNHRVLLDGDPTSV